MNLKVRLKVIENGMFNEEGILIKIEKYIGYVIYKKKIITCNINDLELMENKT